MVITGDLSQVDLPVPLGPKMKKLPSGAPKNLSVNFFIVPLTWLSAKLTQRANFKSQFYPLEIKLQGFFALPLLYVAKRLRTTPRLAAMATSVEVDERPAPRMVHFRSVSVGPRSSSTEKRGPLP